MKEQVEKAIGLIALGFIMVISAIVGIVWYVIPSIILCALVSASFAWIFWMLALKSVSFDVVWLVCTVLIYLAFIINSRNVENEAKVKLNEMLEDEQEV